MASMRQASLRAFAFDTVPEFPALMIIAVIVILAF